MRYPKLIHTLAAILALAGMSHLQAQTSQIPVGVSSAGSQVDGASISRWIVPAANRGAFSTPSKRRAPQSSSSRSQAGVFLSMGSNLTAPRTHVPSINVAPPIVTPPIVSPPVAPTLVARRPVAPALPASPLSVPAATAASEMVDEAVAILQSPPGFVGEGKVQVRHSPNPAARRQVAALSTHDTNVVFKHSSPVGAADSTVQAEHFSNVIAMPRLAQSAIDDANAMFGYSPSPVLVDEVTQARHSLNPTVASPTDGPGAVFNDNPLVVVADEMVQTQQPFSSITAYPTESTYDCIDGSCGPEYGQLFGSTRSNNFFGVNPDCCEDEWGEFCGCNGLKAEYNHHQKKFEDWLRKVDARKQNWIRRWGS